MSRKAPWWSRCRVSPMRNVAGPEAGSDGCRIRFGPQIRVGGVHGGPDKEDSGWSSRTMTGQMAW